jgi:two-component system, cell cycle response regulator
MAVSTQEFKILVADDSRLYRKLIGEALAQEEYVVCFAKNGREASDLLATERPAVVITDWEMPDVTGIELCGQIRRDQSAYTYIILLTGNTDKDQIMTGLSAGADDYLTKPFHPGELLARVAVGRRIVELHREIQSKNRLLEELALTDSLTGLPNRRAIEDWAARQLSGAARHGFPFWVVMADLDSFKSVNDTHGHEGGDIVLQKFADLLRANTRASDICGRIGGEEFIVAMTHLQKPDTQMVIDRIRRKLEAERFTLGGHTFGVTVSFGISGFQGGQPPKFSQLVREADTALYAAKNAGRNRVEFATCCSKGLLA